MKYIDTNVLVRIITGDDEKVAKEAIQTIEQSSPNEFYILDAILVELCFILEFHTYAMVRKDIVLAIETLIAAPQITVSEKTPYAIALYGKYPKLDYADCLLIALGGKTGLMTFDKDLQKALLYENEK